MPCSAWIDLIYCTAQSLAIYRQDYIGIGYWIERATPMVILQSGKMCFRETVTTLLDIGELIRIKRPIISVPLSIHLGFGTRRCPHV